MIKLNDKQGLTAFETEAEEINSRRLKMINHIKVVQEFSQSNVPLLMDNICLEWQSQLDSIRFQESQMTGHNQGLVIDLKEVQDNKSQLMIELREKAKEIDIKLEELEITEKELEEYNEKIQ